MIDDILPHLFSRMRLSICQRLQRRQHTFFISRNHSIRFLWGETVLSYSIPSSGSVCNSVANAKKFFVGLATVLQTPESFSWDLQRCCKRQKVFRETCNGVANARKFFAGLATVLQTPESFSRDLQQCCKRLKIFRGTCNSVANAKKFFAGLATVLQTPKNFSRDLQHCCKHFQYRNSPNSLRMISSFRSADSTRPTMRASMPNERLRAMTSSARWASK